MSRARELVGLLDGLYEATLERDAWWRFARRLSAAFGDAAVAIAMQLPGPSSRPEYYGARLHPAEGKVFGRHFARGLPWGPFVQPAYLGRFGWPRDVLSDASVSDTDFYKDWMKPQGLVPTAPLAHVIEAEGTRALASIALFRRAGCRPFHPDDLDFADELVPHLARAYRLHAAFRGVRSARAAYRASVDRLSVGLILLDASGRPVLVNESARRMLERKDGLTLGEGGPRAANATENLRLHELLAVTARRAFGETVEAGGVLLSVSRPSGRRAFTVLVAPLLAAPEGTGPGDPVVGIYVADPDAMQFTTSDVFQEILQLTPAEADLVRLLANGCKLEEAAGLRGITMNTARTQLKQIFQKTDTGRQAELMRIVLSGLGQLREEPGED